MAENLWFPVTCKENLKLTERETRRTKKPMENNDQRQSYIMITKKLKKWCQLASMMAQGQSGRLRDKYCYCLGLGGGGRLVCLT